MLQRELSYQVPYKRLRKLIRTVRRKAYPSQWLVWLLLALVLAAVFGASVFGENLRRSLKEAGLPYDTDLLFFAVFVLLLVGLLWLRRYRVREVKRRVNFDHLIRLRQDDGGLHIMTDDIEYYLKWQGLSQLLLERDGVVVSHGNLFFLIPDKAFASAEERTDFIRDVYGRLKETARAISEKHVQAALREGGQRASA